MERSEVRHPILPLANVESLGYKCLVLIVFHYLYAVLKSTYLPNADIIREWVQGRKKPRECDWSCIYMMLDNAT